MNLISPPRVPLFVLLLAVAFLQTSSFIVTPPQRFKNLSPSINVLKSLSTETSDVTQEVEQLGDEVKEPVVPRGKQPEFAIEGDTLENEPSHVLLTTGFWGLAVLLIGSYGSSVNSPVELVAFVITFAVSTIFSDFFSGVFHWSVDNYGNGKTPVLGAVIEAFQGHHNAPWTITYRPFANNVHKICKAAIPLALVAHFSPIPMLAKFFTVLWLCFQVLSQEFHKYSHMINPPKVAQFLQSKNLIISRKVHGLHHSSPFEGNYCILTGWCNSVLDKSKVFRAMEKLVYEFNGVEPNCWKLDPSVKKEALSLW
mmetsp:Transcript_16569/g.21940  ORF Transcript_16569/g.21940 Transcript_16569/m.21940 type:complete len:311 (+) Transcript_16569:177-1109(+)